VKTAISIPDDLFEQAERVAARRGCTRSRLYADALAALIAKERSAPRVFGAWAGKVTVTEGTDLVGSDPAVLAMFED
jgi:metal-responsive CopG/Arc/MetJ family transcriptional regulator